MSFFAGMGCHFLAVSMRWVCSLDYPLLVGLKPVKSWFISTFQTWQSKMASIIIRRLHTFTLHFSTFSVREKLQNLTGVDMHSITNKNGSQNNFSKLLQLPETSHFWLFTIYLSVLISIQHTQHGTRGWKMHQPLLSAQWNMSMTFWSMFPLPETYLHISYFNKITDIRNASMIDILSIW